MCIKLQAVATVSKRENVKKPESSGRRISEQGFFENKEITLRKFFARTGYLFPEDQITPD